MPTTQPSFDEKQKAIYYEKVDMLTEEATYQLDDVISALGIRKLLKQGKMLIGPCPIHGGDRPNAFNMYPDGHTVRCYWKCRSKQCDKTFKCNLFGFIRGVLSREKLGYESGSDKSKVYPFGKTVRWLEDFLEKRIDTLKVSYEDIEKKKFIQQVETLRSKPFKETKGFAPETIKGRLTIPSPYFVKRGFSEESLRTYCVGEARENKITSPMCDRAIVPVFNEEGKLIIGFTGRSLFEKCSKCDQWHNPSCPCGPAGSENCKWRNTFERDGYLYGLSHARQAIKASKKIAIVEGPGEVWKLFEAGYEYAVSLFGVNMSDRQQILIEKSGAEIGIVIMDNDEAGELARRDIQNRLGNWLKLKFVKPSAKDLGDMNVEDVRSLLKNVV